AARQVSRGCIDAAGTPARGDSAQSPARASTVRRALSARPCRAGSGTTRGNDRTHRPLQPDRLGGERFRYRGAGRQRDFLIARPRKKLDMKRAIIATIQLRGDAWEAVGSTPYVIRESVADLLALLREDGQLNGPADVDAFLDPRFLRDVEKETRH